MSASGPGQPSGLARLLRARPEELRAAAASGLLMFCLLACYFALRPVRDAMGVQAGLERLPELVRWTLLSMLVLGLAFGGLVARLPRRRFLPVAFRAFALMLLGFAAWAGAHGVHGVHGDMLFAKTWFVWLSVFNMFVVSVFWGFMADTWSAEQARRLYGPIGVGGTLGAILGGLLVPALKAARGALGLGGEELAGLLVLVFVVAALLLEVCVRLTRRVTREAAAAGLDTGRPASDDESVLGGSALEGLAAIARSRYLVGVATVVVLYSVVSTLLYVLRLRAVGASTLSAAARVELFSWSEIAAQTITLLTQLFLTARLLPRLGVGVTLALGPLVTGVLLLVLVPDPSLPLVVGAVALTRATHFALAKPAQEALFSVVRRVEKYKAKSLLDTCGARLGDWLGTEGVGVLGGFSGSLSVLPLAGLPLCGLWLGLSLALGRAQARRVADLTAPPRPASRGTRAMPG